MISQCTVPIFRTLVLVEQHNRVCKSHRTLQNRVRINIVPAQLTLFVNKFVAFKNALFNSFLLYCPDNCSKIHALPHLSNEKFWYKL